MADEQNKPITVTMRASQYHTYDGNAYDIGDTYELPADLVASLEAQGKAHRLHPEPPPAAKPSHPVEPMTTENITGSKPKK